MIDESGHLVIWSFLLKWDTAKWINDDQMIDDSMTRYLNSPLRECE